MLFLIVVLCLISALLLCLWAVNSKLTNKIEVIELNGKSYLRRKRLLWGYVYSQHSHRYEVQELLNSNVWSSNFGIAEPYSNGALNVAKKSIDTISTMNSLKNAIVTYPNPQEQTLNLDKLIREHVSDMSEDERENYWERAMKLHENN